MFSYKNDTGLKKCYVIKVCKIMYLMLGEKCAIYDQFTAACKYIYYLYIWLDNMPLKLFVIKFLECFETKKKKTKPGISMLKK